MAVEVDWGVLVLATGVEATSLNAAITVKMNGSLSITIEVSGVDAGQSGT